MYSFVRQMNNFDNTDEWNIKPEQQADDGTNKWNYALLVPMLGLAVFRWSWLRRSRKEIEQITVKYDEIMNTIKMEQEQERSGKHREIEALNEKKDQERVASVALQEVEDKLMERQWAYCSKLVTRLRRKEIEKELLTTTAEKPVFAHLEMEKDLKEIFKHDRSCADFLNKDTRRNGRLMWLYLEDWKRKLGLKTSSS